MSPPSALSASRMVQRDCVTARLQCDELLERSRDLRGAPEGNERERERFVHQRFSVFWLLALPPLSCHRRESERERERKKRGRNMVSSDAPPVSVLL